jgi:hypothetical protein
MKSPLEGSSNFAQRRSRSYFLAKGREHRSLYATTAQSEEGLVFHITMLYFKKDQKYNLQPTRTGIL